MNNLSKLVDKTFSEIHDKAGVYARRDLHTIANNIKVEVETIDDDGIRWARIDIYGNIKNTNLYLDGKQFLDGNCFLNGDRSSHGNRI